ncbi:MULTISPECIES: FAD-binding oxidoreductase [unclassified Ensifer]|uniref:FAD-binding oxidoreductase n=1 Tax=unclassified Ensifer TaxID=2633371 RepID=UPI000813A88A|nr:MULTISPECIES: FAD-binding oxidoreductase [unclassified Ensifer]OCP17901.1 FAD-linked oxidase [Ensifer sp. LC54]OCP17917.1 FAD-linked oxidase [Ensifer sp. LC384]
MATGALNLKNLEELRKRFRGAILLRGDKGYEGARRIWNGMIDRRPAAIARCTGSADVMAAVRFAREQTLPIAVRCGGHNVAGNAICEGGLVIDLTPMRGVRVDRSRSVVRVGGGALLGDIDHEAQVFGLAVPVGAVSETGIGGLALHGGLGFLTRKYGLTSDNLLSADVVTADGKLITADEQSHPDLLWALKGGGGNFGVVTSFEFQLHPLGPDVYFLLTFYPASAAEKVLTFFRSFMPSAPDELMALAIHWNAPKGDPIPEEHRGVPVMVVVGCWCGPLDQGEQATLALRQIATPIADLSGPMPFVEVQQVFDPDYPHGLRYYWKSLYLDELSDDVIHLACEAGAGRPTPLSTVEVWALGGAMGRVQPEATAFYHREAPFLLTIEANAEDPAADEANIAWVRQWHEDAAHVSRGGTYFNFGGFWEGGEEMLALSFGANYARIREVKTKYDPENVFYHNLQIPVGRTGTPL